MSDDHVAGKQLLKSVSESVALAILLGGGFVIGVASIRHGVIAGVPPVGRLLSLAALFGLALPLFGIGYRLWRHDVGTTQVWHVTSWTVAGMVPLTVLALLTIYYQRAEGVELAATGTIVVWVAGTGMVCGMLIGIYDYRREQAQRDARTTADRLHTINKLVPIPIIRRNSDGTVTHWNPAAKDVFGWTATEILGEPYPIVPEENQDEYQEYQQRAEAGEALRGVETQRERRDGSMVDVQIWSAPHLDDDGELQDVVLSFADVTDLKERERALYTLQQVARKLVRARTKDEMFERATIAVEELFEEPLAGCWQYNETAEELQPVCQTPAATDLIGEQPTLQPEHSLAWRAYETGEKHVYDDVSAETGAYNQESPLRGKIILPLGDFGVMIVASTEPEAFDELDVEIADALAAATETALERAQREANLRLFRRAVEEAGHSVLITDRNGIILYVNPAWEEVTGYTRQETLGRNPRIVNSGKQPENYYEKLWETILAGDVWESEMINQRKSGELYHVEQTIAPITNDDGDITHFVAIESDISDRRLRQQRLTVLNRILRHNLRNAMTIVKGNASLLRDALEDDDLHSNATAIAESAKNLIKISEDAATMQTLFESKPEPEPTCDVTELLTELADDFNATYTDAAITVNVPDDTIFVQTDDRIKMAIREAVDNAVVHSDQTTPEVTVTVSAATTSNSDEWVEIAITDYGPGIPEEEQTVIEVGVETPLLHGSGLGVWLIYWVTASFGGEVSIKENDPQGTIITLRLPAVTT